MGILSIQSAVAWGHVGNSAAVFPLERLGFEVWPVDTVQLANHRGYPSARGGSVAPELLAEVIAGLAERGAFAECEAVLSGYLEREAIGEVVLDAVIQAKGRGVGTLYCCDPVIGDDGKGVYVAPEVARLLRERALPLADIATPNRFELEWLTAAPVTTLADAVAAVRALQALGPAIVLATSLPGEREDEIEVVAASRVGRWRIATPRLPIAAHGAGDLTAAVFLGHLLRGTALAEALTLTANTVFAILEATLRRGRSELALVAAQDAIADPPRRFRAERIG